MATNELSRFSEQILAGAPTFLIGTHRVPPTDREDYTTIVSSLSIWGCILLDQCDLIGYRHGTSILKGRIRKVQLSRTDGVVDLTPSFRFIDKCYDIVLDAISSDRGFKGPDVIISLKSVTTAGSPWFRQCIHAICTALSDPGGELGEAFIVGELLQCLSFLRKVELDRPDLTEELYADYLDFENNRVHNAIAGLDDPTTRQIIHEMNEMAVRHCSNFSMRELRPRHGPGAVSDVSVKWWYQKYTTMTEDARIQFLLRVHGLGTMLDYNPVLKPGKSSRCSRFVGVPKTWKKLRGIAAEPGELQFFQQAVSHSLDEMYRTDPWWRSRVDLHSQEKSQALALEGSRTGRLATIDLSAASDSVTLELIRRVFRGTPILKWLLGTRSTSTMVGNVHLPLRKFASMGSACCFPVQCAVFALAAQVASDRTPGRLVGKTRTIRVFGDDIIVESVTVPCLLDILARLGFSVNTEKSYWTGSFREACGTFAYSGVDVRPLRYSRGDYVSTNRIWGYEELSSAIGIINQCWEKGYHETRRSLLESVLCGHIQMGKVRLSASQALHFSFDGTRGSVASIVPTNFHLCKRWNRSLHRVEINKVQWVKRYHKSLTVSVDTDVSSRILYTEWLIAHQGDEGARPGPGDLDFNPTRVIPEWERIEIGCTMVPTCKWSHVMEDTSLS